jgi:hypothetical protein
MGVGVGAVGGEVHRETLDVEGATSAVADAVAASGQGYRTATEVSAFAVADASSGIGYGVSSAAYGYSTAAAIRDTVVIPDDASFYGCVRASTITDQERRLWAAYPLQALEELRKATLSAASEDIRIAVQARSVVSLAFEGDVQAFTRQVYTPPLGLASIIHCDRRRVYDIDADLAKARRWFVPAAQELLSLGVQPMYVDMYLARMTSGDYVSRVSSAASAVLLTAVLLNDAA